MGCPFLAPQGFGKRQALLGCLPDAPGTILATAPWPERELALVALFLVSGIRKEGEAVALSVASIAGPAGARRREVTGKGNKSRSIPIDPPSRTSWPPTGLRQDFSARRSGDHRCSMGRPGDVGCERLLT